MIINYSDICIRIGMGRNYLTLEEKEFFVMANEYYGKNIKPEDLLDPSRKFKRENKRKLFFRYFKYITKD